MTFELGSGNHRTRFQFLTLCDVVAEIVHQRGRRLLIRCIEIELALIPGSNCALPTIRVGNHEFMRFDNCP